MRNTFLALAFAISVPAAGAEESEIRAMAWLALSPDGRTLAFEWLNDIWIAPSKGGEAARLTTDPARDAYPKFTPDGKRIVFSSARSGSLQVHSMTTEGSDLRQHSANTEGCTLEAISPDGSHALALGVRESTGYEPTRLLVIDLGREARERMLFDATAHSASISPDGARYLFCRGGEQLYRKGYRGSRASQIHLFDGADGSFRKVIAGKWEARSPLWMPQGKGFYFLSNETGTFNVHSHDLAAGATRQLTFFEDDSVVGPALSSDGTVMVFRAGQAVYHFKPTESSTPEEVHFFTKEKLPARYIRKEKVTGTSSVAFSPVGSHIVFSAAGDLWTMDSQNNEVARLTETDDLDEREVQLSPSGRLLCFLRDDGIRAEVCTATWLDTMMGKVAVLPSSGRSKRNLRFSPDGKMLSWLEATGDLVVSDVSGNGAKIVMHCWDMPTYDWSPDGRWLVVAAKDLHSNRDIWMVPSDGSREPTNLTTHPAYEGSPKWSPDGRSIVFLARRGPDELARLWHCDVGDHLRNPDVDFAALAATLRPVDTDVSELIRIAWAPDSKSVLFQSRDVEDDRVYAQPVAGGEAVEYAGFRGIPVGISENGALFWRVDRVPGVYWGKVKEAEFRFEFSVRQDRSERMRLGFRRIWRTLSERFYDETMNGRDWPAVLSKYENAAASSMDSRQFDRVVAQLLGELNASHLTFRTTPWGGKDEELAPKHPTAHPGIVFRNNRDGALEISRLIQGSPVSLLGSPPLPGETVIRIGGQTVDATTPLEAIFKGTEGISLPILVSDAKGRERAMELIPIGYEEARELDREAKVDSAAVAAGKHRIAYLPFRRMKSDDLRELAVEVYRASLDSEGLILDLRDNAGGRVADELLGIFCQPSHTFTIPRGGEVGYPVDRRVSPSWDGPMVVLCNGNTYSNAEIFCRAFKQLKRGKLVGEPTNGGVISAVPVKIPEVGELQVPFRGWFDSETGLDLELNGAVPDLVVGYDPRDQVEDRDPQLSAAIDILTKEIAEKSPPPRARVKGSGR
jgi:tricorn protease